MVRAAMVRTAMVRTAMVRTAMVRTAMVRTAMVRTAMQCQGGRLAAGLIGVSLALGCAGKSQRGSDAVHSGGAPGGNEDSGGGNSGSGNGSGGNGSGGDGSGGNGSGDGVGGNLGTTTGSIIIPNGGAAGSNSCNDGVCNECPEPVPLTLNTQVLAVVFGISSSMGSDEQPEFSRSLKWAPSVAALEAFFTDPASAGTLASLSFFPSEAARLVSEGPMSGGLECQSEQYELPNLGLTPLPSSAFGDAIAAVTPADADSWRLGRPIAAAVEGTLTTLGALQAADAKRQTTLVLITDGLPSLCGEAADQVATVANTAAAAATAIPTAVIGLANPVSEAAPTPAEALAEFEQVGELMVVETGDPAQTTADLRAALESIRDRQLACTTTFTEQLPESFDPQRVNVSYTSAAGELVPLNYDPTCAADNAWHYDDERNVTSIVLCPDLCARVGTDNGTLHTEFWCRALSP